MKFIRNVISAVALLAILAPQAAQAATKKKFKKTSSYSSASSSDVGDSNVSLNIYMPFVSGGSVGFAAGYEYALRPNQSLQGYLSYDGRSDAVSSITQITLTGEYRFFVMPTGKMQGAYVGPLARLIMASYSYKIAGFSGSASQSVIGVGGEGGYQWILPNHLMLNAGGDFSMYMYSGASQSWLTLKGAVGYNF